MYSWLLLTSATWFMPHANVHFCICWVGSCESEMPSQPTHIRYQANLFRYISTFTAINIQHITSLMMTSLLPLTYLVSFDTMLTESIRKVLWIGPRRDMVHRLHHWLLKTVNQLNHSCAIVIPQTNEKGTVPLSRHSSMQQWLDGWLWRIHDSCQLQQGLFT